MKGTKKIKSKELVIKEEGPLVESTPTDMIKMAITSGADLDKLEKLLTLQERWDANEAKKAYHAAMSAFKAAPPQIKKNKKVGFNTSKGPVGYYHATLANVAEKINEVLSEHGLSASWSTKQNGAVTVTCKITHCKGHSEETSLTAGADVSGSKNPIQAIGSTITYLERYTLLALTGLATSDMDDDAKNGGEREKTTVSMASDKTPKEKEEVMGAEINGSPEVEAEPEQEQKSDTGLSGVISKEMAQSLQKLSAGNGYTKEEVYEVIGALGYTKTVEILNQDYPTLMKAFDVKADFWRQDKATKAKEQQQTWEE